MKRPSSRSTLVPTSLFRGIAFALALVTALPLTAAPSRQSLKGLVLDFVDGKELDIVFLNGKKASLGKGLNEGDLIPEGATISTGANTKVELKLQPNGSYLKVGPKTILKLESLPTATSKDNAFALMAGKVRVIAMSGKGEEYSFRTP